MWPWIVKSHFPERDDTPVPRQATLNVDKELLHEWLDPSVDSWVLVQVCRGDMLIRDRLVLEVLLKRACHDHHVSREEG